MKAKILASFLTLVLFFSGGVIHPAFAAQFEYESGDRFVEFNEDLDDDLYISGDQNVLVKGNITGDLFVASGEVDVKGNVGGTIYAAGGTIVIGGDVGRSVFVAGGQIDINGNVSRDVFAAAGTLNIKGNVGEDAMLTGGQITIKGDVGDDVRASAGTLKIEGSVGDDLLAGVGQLDIRGDVMGDAYISAESVVIRSEQIMGDLVFYGDENQLDISEMTIISGETSIEPTKINQSPDFDFPNMGAGFLGLSGFALLFKIILTFFQSLGLALLGWLVYKVAPVKLDGTLNKMSGWSESGKSMLYGFLIFPIGIFLFFILGISVIGWPILKVLLALFTIASTLVVPVVGLYIGRWILKELNVSNSTVLALFLGIFLIQFVRLFPIIGGLFYAVIFLIAVGAMVRMQYEKYEMAKEVRKK